MVCLRRNAVPCCRGNNIGGAGPSVVGPLTGVRRSSGSRAPHLQLRRGVVHLRVRVPDDVRPCLGLREVRRSLGPCSYTRARLLVAIYAARVMEVFEMVRTGSPTREFALHQVRQCFVDLIGKRERHGRFGPESDQPELEIDEQREASQDRIAQLQGQVATREYDRAVQQIATPYVLAAGHAAESAGGHVILEGVARAMIEDQRLFVLRLSDGLSPFVPGDSLFQVSDEAVQLTSPAPFQAMPQVKGPTVAEAVRLYLEHGRGQWVPKTYEARLWQLGYLSINDDNGASPAADRKHLKTAAAVRLVPLHTDVMLLGFGGFVEKLRSKSKGKGSARVFPEVLYGSDGQASTVFSKFFARLMHKVGLTDPALVFHSFRHGAQDAFRNGKQPQYVIDRIIGHNDGKTSSGYGEGIDLETAHEAVQAMKLPVRLLNLCAPGSQS